MRKRNGNKERREKTVRLIGSVLSAHLNVNHPPSVARSHTQTNTCQKTGASTVVLLTITGRQGRWLST